jgi:Protein of unknown function (DUF2735)
MTTNFPQETPQVSAKIYQFPARARKAVDGRREQTNPALDLVSPRVSLAAVGSGWYHEAAIQESKRIRER